MSRNDSFGDRMKSYEALTDIRLMRRLPVVLRLDGKGFSRLTKRIKCVKPFDEWFMATMELTTQALASRIQGCVIGYTQSDEITLILFNDRSIHDEPYFDNRVQKIDSIAASMATVAFNKALWKQYGDELEANFDARVLTVPNIMEATNALIWRQQDCTRNSILSAVYYELGKKFGRGTAQKMMHKRNTSELQEMLFAECSINWGEFYTPQQKNGTMVVKEKFEIRTDKGNAIRQKWRAAPAPIFQSESGRNFLLDLFAPPIKGESDG